jgi:Kef-type K+ transport system membrane component KefB
MDQQNIQAQQQNKKGIFVDFETLREAKNSADDSFMISFVIFIASILGIIFVNNIASQVMFFLIMILSVFAMGAAASSYNKLDKLRPKVKKIIKETIIYEDGQTEEKEYKY